MYNYFKGMVVEKISHEFRLNDIDKTKHYFIKETNQNELMYKKHKKICTTLYYIEAFLILASATTYCISASEFLLFTWYSYRN